MESLYRRFKDLIHYGRFKVGKHNKAKINSLDLKNESQEKQEKSDTLEVHPNPPNSESSTEK